MAGDLLRRITCQNFQKRGGFAHPRMTPSPTSGRRFPFPRPSTLYPASAVHGSVKIFMLSSNGQLSGGASANQPVASQTWIYPRYLVQVPFT